MRSLAEASAAMESEFRSRQAATAEDMRQIMQVVSRDRAAGAHRYARIFNECRSQGAS